MYDLFRRGLSGSVLATGVLIILCINDAPCAGAARKPISFLAINPSTGATAMEYDPAGLLSKPLPTGSLIKVFTALAALKQNPSLASLTAVCGRSSTSQDPYDGCWYLPGHGRIGMSEALAFSCNRYFRILGERINPAIFWTTLVEFDLINPTQAAAHLSWPSRRTVEAMIGLSARLLVPPRKMLAAYCCLVNGGFLFRPGELTGAVRFVPIDPYAVRIISEGLFGCCAYGTGTNACLATDESVAGKTGTAAYCFSGTVIAGKTHGLFIGFSPAGRHPDTGVIVFSLEGTGSAAAGTAEPILSVLSLLAQERQRQHHR